MKITKLYACFSFMPILILTHSVTLYAQDPPPLFSHTLFSDTFTLQDNFSGTYYPTLEKHINSLHPNLGAEVYHAFTLPQSVTDTLSDTEIDKILFETLMAFNTQEGIKYYSHRRQAYRVFITESYTVYSLAKPERQLDIKLSDTSLPATKSLYVYQKDSSFGDGIKHITIQYDENSSQFFASIINEEKLKYKGLITITDPRSFVLNLLINRSSNRIQMYGVFAVDTRVFTSLRKRISISIAYRIYALAQWFEKESTNTLLRHVK